VGSIKANIGHPESSSGLAGVIKACLAIERGLIPPVPDIEHFKQSLLLEDRNIKVS
jgi:acyl transferase domain-containing protein